jgi:hypothetical protein
MFRRWFALAPLLTLGCSASDEALAPVAPVTSSTDLAFSGPLLSWRVADLGTPVGYSAGQAEAISDSGVVVGMVREGITIHPARWKQGIITVLALPAGYSTGHAYAVNLAGTIAGTGRSSLEQRHHALRWTSQGVFQLPDLGYGAYAWGLNDAGTVVGFVYHADSTTSAATWTAAGVLAILTTPSGWTNAKAVSINSSGEVVGIVEQAGTEAAWRWSGAGSGSSLGWGAVGNDIAADGRVATHGSIGGAAFGGTAVPPYRSATVLWEGLAFEVSDLGRVVGVDTAPYPERAVTARGASTTTLPILTGTWGSTALGVNRCGAVVGYATVFFTTRPMRWSRLVCDT